MSQIRLQSPSAVLKHRIVLIQAPAGYGKTTLVRSWQAASGAPMAWVSLTAADDDPLRLWTLIENAAAELTGLATPVPSKQLEEVHLQRVPALAAALSQRAPEGAALVLDNYECIRDADCDQVVQGLIERIHGHVSVVVITRRKPALRLARQLAGGGMVTLGPADLRLDVTEIQASLKGFDGPELTAEQISLVAESSCGWAVAVPLLGKSPGQHIDALADYVDQTILPALPPQDGELLKRLAALDRCTAELARALTAREDLRQAFALLCEHGLLERIEPDGPWYRVHAPLRAPLMTLLERETAGFTSALRLQAADHHESAGFTAAALEQALAAGVPGRVTALLTDHALELVYKGGLSAVSRALQTIGFEQANLSGEQPVLQALALLVGANDGGDVRSLAVLAGELAARSGEQPDVKILTALLLASPDAGNLPVADAAGRRLLAGNIRPPELTRMVATMVAFGLWLQGQLPEARALLTSLSTAQQSGAAALLIHALLALVTADANEGALGERYARLALAGVDPDGHWPAADVAMAHAGLAAALQISGKLAEARLSLNNAQALTWPGSLRSGLVLVMDAELALAERRRSAARLSAARAHAVLDGFPDPGSAVIRRLEAVDAVLRNRASDPASGSMPTPAEMRVLHALEVRLSRAQIARELYLSEATVKSHLRRLYRRLGANTRDEAIAAAYKRGLLAIDPEST